jgi:hypothetical protein
MTDTVSYLVKTSTAQTTTALKSNLTKAKAYAAELEIDESALLNLRLYPNMGTLTRQIQLASDTVARGAARLAQLDMPSFPDTETTFDALIERLDKVNAYVQAIDDAAIDANARVELEVPLGPMTVNWEGRQYLSTFILPNLHFHASIAYALLRQAGLGLGKRDFLMG